MSKRTLISLVFSYFLLINEGWGSNILSTSSNGAPGVNVFYPDTVKKQVDTLAIDDDNGIESEITYNADDSIRLEPDNKKVYLFGNASVHYGDFNLKAAYIEIDSKTNLVTAIGVMDSTGKMIGNPEFKDGQTEMTCEKIIYNTKTKKGKITGILTKQADMFIHGEAVKKDTNNVMYIKNMKCIPCEFDDAIIYFRASKAKVIPNDKIVTGPLFVEVAGIPTPLGLPFGYFPNVKNKSKAGILMPFYGSSEQQGFFLKNLGFFVPTGNKKQFIMYGDVYTNGSFALRPQMLYRTNYRYNGSLNVSFSQFNIGVPENHNISDPNHYQHQRDFRITWSHTQDNKFNPSIRFSASVNAGSSGFNKYNNQSPSVYLNNTLISNIMFTKIFKSSTLTLNARHNQNTSTHDIQIDAPQLTYAVNRFYPFKNSSHTNQNWLDKFYMDYTFQTQATVKTKDSLLFKTSLDKMKNNPYYDVQLGSIHRIPIGTNINLFKYFTLTPSANLSVYHYFQTTDKQWDSLTKAVVSKTKYGPASAADVNFSASLATKVYGDYVFKSKFLKQIRHQIIPSLGFVYHPDLQSKSLDFYRQVQTDTLGTKTYYSRFERGIFGGPNGVESGQITFNINNTLDAKVRQKTDTSVSYKKVAILQMLSIGGNYDVAAKKNNLSIINVSARTSLIKNIVGLMATSTFDPYSVDSKGVRTNFYQYDVNKQIARFTGVNFSVNTAVNNSMIKSMASTNQPWNLSINYNLNIIKNPIPLQQDNKVQTLNATLSICPTTKWKLDIMTNYDFKANNFGYTNIRIHRDLHCWEASINWVPFGFAKQYSVSLNLKTQALRDIKIPKQKQWFDNI
ncbi:MAG TPA: putative LPS assembly protein LptD [Bacteroidia bacterium]|nr:putative LPS assembly protein LptD [Bacteroidia bacterium]